MVMPSEYLFFLYVWKYDYLPLMLQMKCFSNSCEKGLAKKMANKYSKKLNYFYSSNTLNSQERLIS